MKIEESKRLFYCIYYFQTITNPLFKQDLKGALNGKKSICDELEQKIKELCSTKDINENDSEIKIQNDPVIKE